VILETNGYKDDTLVFVAACVVLSCDNVTMTTDVDATDVLFTTKRDEVLEFVITVVAVVTDITPLAPLQVTLCELAAAAEL
jgi:hypothetical protein